MDDLINSGSNARHLPQRQAGTAIPIHDYRDTEFDKRKCHSSRNRISEWLRSQTPRRLSGPGMTVSVPHRVRQHENGDSFGYRAGTGADARERSGGTNLSYRVRAKRIARIAARIATAA